MPARRFQIEIESKTGKGQHTNQDRTLSVELDDSVVLALADGAGGFGDGAGAANFAIRTIEAAAQYSESKNSLFWQTALMKIDRELEIRQIGTTTLIVVVIHDQSIIGSSVGDSHAWLIAENNSLELTQSQRRKPLLGDGGAMPVAFEFEYANESCLLGSDGLFNYSNVNRLLDMCKRPTRVESLVAEAELPNGGWPDDTTAILASPIAH